MTLEEMKRLRERWCNFMNQHTDNRYYVYVYRYPRGVENAGQSFYIGRGTRDRVFSHLDLVEPEDLVEHKKVDIINLLKSKGLCPDIYILSDNLSFVDAMKTESTAIDAVGIENLTNLIPGYSSQMHSIQENPRVLRDAEFKHNMIGININKTFVELFNSGHYDKDDVVHQRMLYECVSYAWPLDVKRLRRDNIKYYFAVYQGVILDVFKFADIPYMKVCDAMTMGFVECKDGIYTVKEFKYRQNNNPAILGERQNRVMLFGHIAEDEVRNQYFQTVVPPGTWWFPVRYFTNN